MKHYLFFLSAAVCASAAVAQIPDTSPRDLSGSGVSDNTNSQQPAPPRAPIVQSPSPATSSYNMSSGASSGTPALQNSGGGGPAAADVPSVGDTGTSRPLGGYWLGGGNVYGGQTGGGQSSGMSATSNTDASNSAPSASARTAGNRSAGTSSAASGQSAGAGNAAKPPNVEDCRTYARHSGAATQAGGQTSSGQAADPCAGLDQGTAQPQR